MKCRRKTALILSVLLLAAQLAIPAASTGVSCTLCESLKEAGFPPSYLEGLCALSLAHPNWQFEPLPVTALSREKGKEYGFPFVVGEEWKVAGRSLVSAREAYAPYREEESELYDSGFYRANRAAISYFMDPRNFFSEGGIFQFLLLIGGETATVAEVEAVLAGSAVLSAFREESLGSILIRLGRETGLNPLFLAVRLRQEQGREGNALLYGTVGSALGGEDRSLDGYYNPFNLSASGTGEGQILRSGAEYAKKRGWDSAEKGLRGGAEKLAAEYVGKHQNTLYLQKWNVDPRSENASGSRNFWAQYMQNIGAAKTEGDFLAEALASSEAALCFLIPVYEAMPAACPDPAGGSCAVFASSPYKSSPHLAPVQAEVSTTISLPTSAPTVEKKGRIGPLILLQTGVAGAAAVLFFLARRGKRKEDLSKIPKKN